MRIKMVFVWVFRVTPSRVVRMISSKKPIHVAGLWAVARRRVTLVIDRSVPWCKWFKETGNSRLAIDPKGTQ